MLPVSHMRELVKELAKSLSIKYQQSWFTREVPVDRKLANVMPIYKEGQKDDLGNYRSVSLSSVLVKVLEEIILSAIMQHMQGIRPSQYGFRKGRTCLTNLIFYNSDMLS
ncbi:hypothetical protein TURU_008645 [Turdus rufiventris]|nr:hypothetical protein TURU_008645 [Turdus rufiventris]